MQTNNTCSKPFIEPKRPKHTHIHIRMYIVDILFFCCAGRGNVVAYCSIVLNNMAKMQHMPQSMSFQNPKHMWE